MVLNVGDAVSKQLIMPFGHFQGFPETVAIEIDGECPLIFLEIFKEQSGTLKVVLFGEGTNA